MKKLQRIFILLAFVLLMTACSKGNKEDSNKKPSKPKNEVVENTEKFAKIDVERYEAYLEVVEDIIKDNKWPDGQQVIPDGEYIGNNMFAIFDIDMDGEEELLVDIEDTVTAGMILQIYDYDAEKDEVIQGEGFFPASVFYDNGVVKQYYSRNHTSSDVWPYAVSKFDQDKNAYEMMGNVYAEDKEIMGDSFASEKDADNDGRIYYISSKDVTDKALTEKEYQEWDASFTKDAKELYIPWQNLWEHNVECIEAALELKEAAVPIPLRYNSDIWNYDVTGDGQKDHIYITYNDLGYYETYEGFGSDWSIEINGEKVHDFDWEDDISLEVVLYQISDQRQYLAVRECYETNDDIGGYGLYQMKDGKLVQVCDFYDGVVSSINDFHYGVEILYITKDEMKVRAHNQFNATASLEFDMIFKYDKDAWSTGTNEFEIIYQDYHADKEDGMTANQSFVVYKQTDGKEEAFKVKKGDVLFVKSVKIENGAAYFKVTNQSGQEGWLPDPDEPYTEINGEYIDGYFEEAMFAG